MSEEKQQHENDAAGRRNIADNAKQTIGQDAAGLGPMRLGSIAIGLVDEIVGEGGVEVPGLVDTKYESLLLVRHWAAEIIDLDFDYFLLRQHRIVGMANAGIREPTLEHDRKSDRRCRSDQGIPAG